MKKQAIVTALGVLVALAMTAPSFAATSKHHAVTRPRARRPIRAITTSAVPEGNYTGYAPSYATGGLSGAMGGFGH